ncbi:MULTISPECIES: glycosyltransferase family A protein [unclassified Devosia]|uniref:glycosyltransferase family 2 protein n=1 Tax=unclassified Devosia TaxID=196773 RepID=UPI00155246C8|nr:MULTISPECIES: glycosyltransferase family A protein [unclassified Devosia]
MPLISVILPTFNRAHSLPGAMGSVLTQSFQDLELIVVDDASTQDISALVQQIDDPRVRLVRRPVNGGAAAARNSGIDEARGAFIAFQDSDDLWLPGKLEAQLVLLAGLGGEFGAVTGPKIYYGRDDRLRYGPGHVSVTPSPKGRLPAVGDQVGRLLDENRLSVQCALFRADCMPPGPWFDERARANEDWEFAVRLAQHTKIFEHTDAAVLGFVSGDSISMNSRRQMLGELLIAKNNKQLLQRYPRQKAAIMRNAARVLLKTGKPRMARRLLLASIAHYPPSTMTVLESLSRKLRGGVTLAGQRLGLVQSG